MPRSQRYAVRRLLDITPAMSRRLDRLSRRHERAVPDLIGQAIAQAYGPPSEEDRQPSLLEGSDSPAAGGKGKSPASDRKAGRELPARNQRRDGQGR